MPPKKHKVLLVHGMEKSLPEPFSFQQLIVPATRYYFGRTSIAAHRHAQALAQYWPELDESCKSVLRRDIIGAIALDDADRESPIDRHGEEDDGCYCEQGACEQGASFYLGADCDREMWLAVKEAWEKFDRRKK